MARVKVLVQEENPDLWFAKVPCLSTKVVSGATRQQAIDNVLTKVSVKEEPERDSTWEDL